MQRGSIAEANLPLNEPIALAASRFRHGQVSRQWIARGDLMIAPLLLAQRLNRIQIRSMTGGQIACQ